MLGRPSGGTRPIPVTLPKTTANSSALPTKTAEDWVWECCQDQGLGFVRSQMGRMLFSGDDGKKRLGALSGGEAARLVFCRLAIAQPNVLVLDEPTNHLDLESIEALVEALKNYPGTLLIVSHDRWFISQLATRIVEIKPEEILDFRGTYEEYVHFCGDDHLDADQVILKARQAKKKKEETNSSPAPRSNRKGKNKQRRTAGPARKTPIAYRESRSPAGGNRRLALRANVLRKDPARPDQGPRMRTRGYRARVGGPFGGMGGGRRNHG